MLPSIFKFFKKHLLKVMLIVMVFVWVGVGCMIVRGNPLGFLPSFPQLPWVDYFGRLKVTEPMLAPTPISVPDVPTPTLPAKLQNGLKKIEVNEKDGVYFIHGRIESIEELVATVVTLDSRLVVRLDTLPLYKVATVEFDSTTLTLTEISDFKVESEVVIVYNYLGYPEKIVLIKS